jgi:hypothetical protein
MFSSLRERFGTAGLVVAVIALIAAIGGTAIAAGGLTGKQKKEVKKIAKQFAGKPGPAGPAGPAGPQGPKGDTGAAGVNPVGTAFTGAANGCKEGGVKYVGANTTIVCNGPKGQKGAPGAAGWATNLPPGEMLTGAYSTGWGSEKNAGSIEAWPPKTVEEDLDGAEAKLYEPEQYVDFSFNIPLTEAPQVVWLNEAEDESPGIKNGWTGERADCKGDKEEPKPDPGVLCIYTRETGGAGSDQEPTIAKKMITRFGVVINADFSPSEAWPLGLGVVSGTWAVKAPCTEGEEEVEVKEGEEVVEVTCQLIP